MTAKTHAFLAVVLATVAVSSLGFVSAPASLAESPWWHLTSSLRPATLPRGGEGTLVIQALNVGNAPTSGPVTVSVILPAGVALKQSKGVPQVFFTGPLNSPPGLELGPTGPDASLELCKVTADAVACTTNSERHGFEFLAHIASYEQLEIRVQVIAEATSATGDYEARISGGEAAPVSARSPLTIGEDAPLFGVEEFALVPEEEGGGADVRAGSHPYQLTNTFDLNQSTDLEHPPALPKNIQFKLPPGQLGNATAVPRCTTLEFSTLVNGGNLCPSNTVLGVASVTIYEPANIGLKTIPVPLFNLEPKYGEPARFGFAVEQSPVILDTSVRGGGSGEREPDYGITVSTTNITQIVNFISSTVTFWGAPADHSHDQSRGWSCLANGFYGGEFGACASSGAESKPPVFLTMPTSCNAPFATTVEGVSWPNQANPVGAALPSTGYSLEDGSGRPLGLVGCNQLPFAPRIETEPSSDSASSPTGLNFDLNISDEGLLSSGGLAQSQLKKVVVALPEGMTANPSLAAGLIACGEAQYESETIDSQQGTGCPEGSKIGTVEVQSPLLEQTLHGSVFIASQNENPFHSLLALYVVIKNPETGIMIKIPGKIEPNLTTGQLVSVFDNTPQLPFSHFRLSFRQGQRSPLVTPPACGVYTTQAELYPWSDPLAPLQDSSTFQVTTGVGGGPCPAGGVPPFQPSVIAGTLNNAAGSYSPFDIQITRNDSEQEITGFSSQLPTGLTANLSGVPFCPETDIALAKTKTGKQEEADPSCPLASQIGHTLVGVGVGSVLAYTPGKLYMAGPFEGASFSVVAITSATVGPFDLGTVVVHLPLRIDPKTAAVSIPVGPSDQIPHIIDGIVVHVRDIRVYVDRSNFTLNPTDCTPLSFSATVIGSGKDFASSADDVPATVADPFQTANCANLGFKPSFQVTTSGKTSRSKGASLSVKLTYPKARQGSQANIRSVKVDLPKQLPSRLSTLQKACPDSTFNANPASCPVESIVGHATAVTPILPVPLTGPAYFVSHAGLKFPELIVVLQGYGVTIDLFGETFISKAGVTSSTFRTVPDQPVTSFALTLPQGPDSALAAPSNLCKTTLKMPTVFTAQNGAVIKQSTPINVTGCPKGRKAKKAHKGGKRKHKS